MSMSQFVFSIRECMTWLRYEGQKIGQKSKTIKNGKVCRIVN